ncbi:MAG: hypothetical protein M0Z54_04615 [Thermaerobacter sp.]|nr:hypothetical protein [Thermaerobacter sp.]
MKTGDADRPVPAGAQHGVAATYPVVGSTRGRAGQRHILQMGVAPLLDAARGRVVETLEPFQPQAA